MKSLTTNITLAAAALLVAAGTVSAQGIKAEIPFQFQVNGTSMPAGSYQLTSSFGSPSIITLSDHDSGRRAMVVGTSRIGDTSRTDAKLVFQCTGDSCVLRQIWTGTAGKNYEVPAPHSRDKELAAVRIVSVRLQ